MLSDVEKATIWC